MDTMKLTPGYVWSEDITALRNERRDLFLQLDGALSMHAHRTILAPFFHELYVWLEARFDAQQARWPPERRAPKSVLRVRGDDVLEGLCIANEQAMHLSKEAEAYFLKHVRALWHLICAVRNL